MHISLRHKREGEACGLKGCDGILVEREVETVIGIRVNLVCMTCGVLRDARFIPKGTTKEVADMYAVEVPVAEEPEFDRVLCWRREQLERAGYDTGAVNDLAGRGDIDLHLAVDLLEKGCPPETALRILL